MAVYLQKYLQNITVLGVSDVRFLMQSAKLKKSKNLYGGTYVQLGMTASRSGMAAKSSGENAELLVGGFYNKSSH